MDGCQEARNAITITEVPCPQCGVGVEVFIRDGSLRRMPSATPAVM